MSTAYCWTDRVEWAVETFGEASDEHLTALEARGVCLLPQGHEGPHDWTPEERIMVTFLDGAVVFPFPAAPAAPALPDAMPDG